MTPQEPVTQIKTVELSIDEELLTCAEEPAMPTEQELALMTKSQGARLTLLVSVAGRDCRSKLEQVRFLVSGPPSED